MSNSTGGNASNQKFELFRKEQLEKGSSFRKRNKNYHDKLDNFFVINHRKINLAILETFNNVAFHALDTIKVRLQAKSIVEDVGGYMKNRVFDKRK